MNNNQEIIVFKHLGIRPTSVRIVVYRAMSKFKDTFNLQDIENELGWMDKSSIFRALTLFSEKKLLHTISDGSGTQKYCVCHHLGTCDTSKLHCHFHCVKCDKTYCLSDITPPHIDTPNGFVVEKVSYIIDGVCSSCSKK